MPTEAECIAAAGEAYGAILADPERREELRRARRAAQTAARSTSAGERTEQRKTRKSA